MSTTSFITEASEIAHSLATTREQREQELTNLARHREQQHVNEALDDLDDNLSRILAFHASKFWGRSLADFPNRAQVEADRHFVLSQVYEALGEAVFDIEGPRS